MGFFFSHGATPNGPTPPQLDFTIILRHTTVGMTRLDEGSARSKDLYLTTHNTHNRQTSMLPAVFEPAVPGIDRLQNRTLECATTGIAPPPKRERFNETCSTARWNYIWLSPVVPNPGIIISSWDLLQC